MTHVDRFGPGVLLLLAAASSFLFAHAAFGQAVETASVSGTVIDPTGTPVATRR